MSQVEVNTWYTDTPWERRMEAPGLWTNTEYCDKVEGDFNSLQCISDRPGGGRNINPNFLQDMESSSFRGDLELETKGGEVLECSTVSRGAGDLVCHDIETTDRTTVSIRSVEEIRPMS